MLFLWAVFVDYSAELDVYHNYGSLRDFLEPWLLK